MIAAAQVIFQNTRGARCLEWLWDQLPPQHVRLRISKTEWRGFATVIPQIRVETKPVPLTIQVDNAT